MMKLKTGILVTARCVVVVMSVCSILIAADAAPKAKPNVIIIYTDDHGYADLGCQGLKTDVKTPNIDALAAGGVRMTAGYVTAPQCGPSRQGMITGQYQGRFGMDNNGSGSDDPLLKERFFSMNNLPKRMKSAGYVTGMAGKSHLGSDDSGELVKLGFDKAFFKHSNAAGHWNMDLTGKDIPPQVQPKGGEYHLDIVTDFTCAFINRFKDQPFFFYTAYRAPHVPLDAPKKYLDRFPGPMPQERRGALAMISAVDDGVGKIMDTLRKNGLEENTLIFLISDNGAPLKCYVEGSGEDSKKWGGSSNIPLNGEKGTLAEGGIRTPFLVHWKGVIPPGQVYQLPVISLDVAATANFLAGLPDDKTLDGVNLMPYLTGANSGAPHDVLFWRWDGQSAIRQGDWKYITCGGRQYLFNLADDKEEKKNLLSQQPEMAKSLRATLDAWGQEMMPKGLGSPTMTGPAKKYYDFYFDGKKSSATSEDTEDADESESSGKKSKKK